MENDLNSAESHVNTATMQTQTSVMKPWVTIELIPHLNQLSLKLCAVHISYDTLLFWWRDWPAFDKTPNNILDPIIYFTSTMLRDIRFWIVSKPISHVRTDLSRWIMCLLFSSVPFFFCFLTNKTKLLANSFCTHATTRYDSKCLAYKIKYRCKLRR